MTQSERILWIDNAKGLILFFVLLYHAKFPWLIVDFVSSWFMPCFFLISGLLFRLKNDSLKQTLIHRTKTLLIPYFALSILFVFLNPNNYDGCSIKPFMTNAWDILMGNSGFMTVSLWFVYVLFEVCCATAILHKFIANFNISLQLCVIGAIMIGCITGDILFRNQALPFKLSDFFIAWLMYLLGYLTQPMLKRLQNFSVTKHVIISFLSLLIAIALFATKNPENYIASEMHRIVLLFAGSFSFIGLTYSATTLIQENFIGTSLRYLANNAMCFLAVHLWVICLCQLYMPVYHPYSAAAIALTISLLIIPLAGKYTPWLIGKYQT